MVVSLFHEVTYVCEECNNLQDWKWIFMITDFKIFPKMLLRWTTFLRLLQRRNSVFLYLYVLLLLSKRGLSPESCLAVCHPMAYELVSYKKSVFWRTTMNGYITYYFSFTHFMPLVSVDTPWKQKTFGCMKWVN